MPARSCTSPSALQRSRPTGSGQVTALEGWPELLNGDRAERSNQELPRPRCPQLPQCSPPIGFVKVLVSCLTLFHALVAPQGTVVARLGL